VRGCAGQAGYFARFEGLWLCGLAASLSILYRCRLVDELIFWLFCWGFGLEFVSVYQAAHLSWHDYFGYEHCRLATFKHHRDYYGLSKKNRICSK
jgi:hypothetical protein